MSRLPMMTFAMLGAAGSVAALAADSPQTVVNRGSYMEATGTIPAAPASPSGCSLEDLDSVETRYVPASCARITIRLPTNMVLTGTRAEVQANPGEPWLTCTPTKLESAEYRACMAKGSAPQTLPDGLVVHPICSKVRRAVCGNLRAVDFRLGNANSSCANMGEESNTVVFGLSNAMRQQPLRYRAIARYKSCNHSGQIESN